MFVQIRVVRGRPALALLMRGSGMMVGPSYGGQYPSGMGGEKGERKEPPTSRIFQSSLDPVVSIAQNKYLRLWGHMSPQMSQKKLP
ncbi:hypothetical protein PIB30_044322 [Stylosanthes scabra]|uniref:Uncharacterized protein n=1 Tax=Stylosanthes scabra TaxID=79078 RepID=A0ABU6ZEL1_9FABA|nr:hypothetical protein [Stylosanthes scabra]